MEDVSCIIVAILVIGDWGKYDTEHGVFPKFDMRNASQKQHGTCDMRHYHFLDSTHDIGDPRQGLQEYDGTVASQTHHVLNPVVSSDAENGGSQLRHSDVII